jgi:Zn-dependent M28 family amino/carboxypeptidase
MNKTLLLAPFVAAGLLACGKGPDNAPKSEDPAAAATARTEAAAPQGVSDDLQAAHESMSPQRLLENIKTLASDEFEGRLPGTPGEEKTIAFLIERFKAMGLEPGNPDGSYIQKVPLVGIEGTPTMQLSSGQTSIPMTFRKDFVATTARFEPQVSIEDSPLVFVGYGVQAPEYGWDDYKGLDVHGKTLVMLINDPAMPDPNDPSKLDETLFKGRGMTYYGRWTYKYEIGSKLGADGVIIVHETEPASYPWSVVESSWTGENFELANPNKNADKVPVQAWITLDKAKELFSNSGQDFDTLKKQALSKDFKPVPLDAKLSVTITNKIREVDSQNAVAKITGSDPALKDQYVIYTAHWDHLGRDPSLTGDQIFNGAVDNASGTAGLLELGRAFKALPQPPRRSILLLAVTGEEQGLLGSKFYAENPLYPLVKTAADINMDAMNPWGTTKDVKVIGQGQNDLEELLRKHAQAADREVVADTNPEKGFYYRSDQFSFARVGVPGLYAESGNQVIGKPEGFGEQKEADYTAHDYHSPSDEVKDGWDLSGMVADLQLLFDVGLDVANADRLPQWKQGSEFKQRRDAMLQSAGQ